MIDSSVLYFQDTKDNDMGFMSSTIHNNLIFFKVSVVNQPTVITVLFVIGIGLFAEDIQFYGQ